MLQWACPSHNSLGTCFGLAFFDQTFSHNTSNQSHFRCTPRPPDTSPGKHDNKPGYWHPVRFHEKLSGHRSTGLPQFVRLSPPAASQSRQLFFFQAARPLTPN